MNDLSDHAAVVGDPQFAPLNAQRRPADEHMRPPIPKEDAGAIGVEQLTSGLRHLHQERFQLLGLVPSLGDFQDRLQTPHALAVLAPAGDRAPLFSQEWDNRAENRQGGPRLAIGGAPQGHHPRPVLLGKHGDGGPVAVRIAGFLIHHLGKQISRELLPGAGLCQRAPAASNPLGHCHKYSARRQQERREGIGQERGHVSGLAGLPGEFCRRHRQRRIFAKSIQKGPV